jgi:hypothetical protein
MRSEGRPTVARPRTDDPEAQEIRAEIAALDRQYAGRRFPADERERWNELNERLEEIDKRTERIRELHAAGSFEETTDPFQPGRPSVAGRPGSGERDAALWTIGTRRSSPRRRATGSRISFVAAIRAALAGDTFARPPTRPTSRRSGRSSLARRPPICG